MAHRTDAILAHYRDRCRDKNTVTVGDSERTDRGEVDEISFDAGPEKDYIRVTVKIPIRRHADG